MGDIDFARSVITSITYLRHTVPVTFTPIEGSDPECSSETTQNYRVDRLVDITQPAFQLIHQTGSHIESGGTVENNRCEYSVSFPAAIASHSEGYTLSLLSDPAPTATVHGGSSSIPFVPTITASYTTPIPLPVFTPQVQITLPEEVLNAPGYVSPDFTALFLLTSVEVGCTEIGVVTYNVLADGTTIIKPGTQIPELVHQTISHIMSGGSVKDNRCEYRSAFNPVVGNLVFDLTASTSLFNGGDSATPTDTAVSVIYNSV